eukprot:m.100760 g.100760  ORF g.100760 m.100760 type:complete len:111 (-) comp9050_c3_seq1:2730-3062(-)
MVTFETIEGVMHNIEANRDLQKSVDPLVFKETQNWMESVRNDLASSANPNWLMSPNFSGLATSFNVLVQPNNILSQIDVANIPVLNNSISNNNMFDVGEEEEEFDWSTIT